MEGRMGPTAMSGRTRENARTKMTFGARGSPPERWKTSRSGICAEPTEKALFDFMKLAGGEGAEFSQEKLSGK